MASNVFDSCIQINLQRGFGGGEVYTAAVARALRSLGIDTRLFVQPGARAWSALSMPDTRVEPLADPAELLERLRGQPPRWLVFHTFAPAAAIEALRARGHFVTAFAHMPLYGRDSRPLRPFNHVFAVSRHVIASLDAAGIEGVYPQPLYGVADIERVAALDCDDAPLRAGSRYDWDQRKLRDRVLGALEPLVRAFMPQRSYTRPPGLALGIVSRLTPIKQFPALFSHLAAVLARHPGVGLDIYGSGGYASVRDLVHALRPIRERVRFWGHQRNVRAVYRQIDFLMTGLPEKEALGLNAIEAQACGTPVLAPDAPPFTETMVHGETGYLYRDPREDRGADFAALIGRILRGGPRPDPRKAAAHLAQFSNEAFVERARRLLAHLAQAFPRAGRE